MKKIIKVNLARPYPKTHWPCESCWGDSRPPQFNWGEPDFEITASGPPSRMKKYVEVYKGKTRTAVTLGGPL